MTPPPPPSPSAAPQWRIRTCVPDLAEGERLATLHALAFPDAARPWGAEVFRDLPPSRHLLTDRAGQAGLLLLALAADQAEIITLAVAPSARRQGLGAALLDAAEIWARDQGAVALFLEVAADNWPARGLYDAQGFRRAGLRRAYYRRPDGPRVDALILTKPLA